MSRIRRIGCLLSCALILLTSCGAAAHAEENTWMMPVILTAYVGDGACGVRAYHAGYENNLYLSLLDLSLALDGTDRQFSFSYGKTAQDGEYHSLRFGEGYNSETNGIAQLPFDQREDVWLTFRRNRLFVDGEDRKYYTYREGGYDLFMSLIDVQLLLGCTLTKLSGTAIRIEPDRPFAPEYSALAVSGYLDTAGVFALGDVNNGTLLFGHDYMRTVSIASTTKLMTYLLTVEAIGRGEIREDTEVTISERVARLSQSADGIIKMEPGQTVTVKELLSAMLVASSNESASALAECVAGSVESFVARMNARAQELGLTTAVFYTPDGLPVYTPEVIPVKRQNCMSASDLFRLSAFIVGNYPAVTAITSQTYASLPSLKYTTANSNPLVFNLQGVNGLKTGSTNRAGYCLVASMPVTYGNETHTLVLVLLGSEHASDRGQAAELLLRCAENEIAKVGFF